MQAAGQKLDKSNIETILPLSNAQAPMLVYALNDQSLDPGLTQTTFTLTGQIHRDDVQIAWDRVIARHQALRMSVRTAPDMRHFLVAAKSIQSPISWHSFESTASAEAAREQFLKYDITKGLILAELPPMRLTAFEVANEATHFVWTRHNILLDAWSGTIVTDELTRLYAELRGGPAATLSRPASVQDVQKHRKSTGSSDHLERWSHYLNNAPDARIAPILASHSEAPPTFYEHPIEDSLATDLQAAAAYNKVSAATLMTAAWGCLVARLLGQTETTISKNVSVRPLDKPGYDRAVGAFTETQPRRISLRGTWADILTRAQTDDAELHGLSYFDYVAGFQQGQQSPPPQFDSGFSYESRLIDMTGRHLDVDGGVTFTVSDTAKKSSLDLSVSGSLGKTPALAVIGMRGIGASDCEAISKAFLALLRLLADQPAVAPLPLEEIDTLLCPLLTRQQPSPLPPTDPRALDQSGHRAQNPAEIEIVRIWQEVLGTTDIDTGLEFGELGGKSVMVLRMLALVEDRLGTRVPLKEFIKNPTVAFLAQSSQQSRQETSSWKMLIPIQPGGTRPPLHFIHTGGTNVLFLRGLAKHLGPDQPLYGYQSVGLEDEAPPLTTVEDMVDVLLPELLSIQPEGPYYLFGHCGGARLAHALTARLEAEGRTVARLILLHARAPAPEFAYFDRRSRAKKAADDFKLLVTGRLSTLGQNLLLSAKKTGRPLKQWLVLRYGSPLQRQVVLKSRVSLAASYADDAYDGGKVKAPAHMLVCDDKTTGVSEWEDFVGSLSRTDLTIPYYDAFFEPHIGEMAEAVKVLLPNPDV